MIASGLDTCVLCICIMLTLRLREFLTLAHVACHIDLTIAQSTLQIASLFMLTSH